MNTILGYSLTIFLMLYNICDKRIAKCHQYRKQCNLNARAIAKKLGVSTQPIFSNFKNMEDLKMEIVRKASCLYFAMLEEEEKSGKYPPYKARGMGYIRFAKEEKNLFRLLFMDKRSSNVKFPTDDASKEIGLISDSLSFSEDKASRMHALLWFFVHGIASLIVTESLELSEEDISAALTDTYLGLKSRFSDE